MDQITHSVKLTKEEIKEIIHALDFTVGEGQELDNDVVFAIYQKLDNTLS